MLLFIVVYESGWLLGCWMGWLGRGGVAAWRDLGCGWFSGLKVVVFFVAYTVNGQVGGLCKYTLTRASKKSLLKEYTLNHD